MCPFLCWLPKCLHWPFCPGIFIAILAFVAAAVTFWERPPRWVKAISIGLFLFLMVGEVWMMSKDRERADNDQGAARTREEENFRLIASDIQASIDQAQRGFSGTMGKAQDNLDHMTGGSSYPYVNILAVPVRGTTNTFRLSLLIIGKNPLFDVSTTVRQLPAQMPDVSEFLATGNMPGVSLAFSGASISPGLAAVSQNTVTPSVFQTTDYQILTHARNGKFLEILHIRKAGDLWEQSFELKKNDKIIKRERWNKFVCANCPAVQPPH
jgi:hypothetical protein